VRFLEHLHGLGLSSVELRLHLGRVFQAGVDRLLARLDIGQHGLEREPPEQESDDRKIDNLGHKKGPGDAEVGKQFGDAAGGGFTVRFDRDLGDVAGGFSKREQDGEHGRKERGHAGGGPAAWQVTTRLFLAEEQRVERDRFGQRHTEDGLNEDLAGRAGIAADGLDGLGADHRYADGGGDASESTLNITSDFCNDVDHVVIFLVGWPPCAHCLGTLPAGKHQWWPLAPSWGSSW